MSSGAQHHPTRITNWPEYNRALVQRGALTFWFPEDIGTIWFHREGHEGRGLSKTFSDAALQVCLMLRLVYKLPLRGLEGFVNSLFELLRLPLKSPDFSVFSKRGRHLRVLLPRQLPAGPLHIVVDSTGLKVFGEGEWKVRQHGVGKRRTWRKLHLGVDAVTLEVVAVELTEAGVADPDVLPALLAQVEDEDAVIGQVSGDGAYDTRGCYDAIAERQAQPCIPPRETAVPWEESHPRTAAVTACRELGRATWKQAVGYHRRSVVETAMYRYKQLIGPHLRARLVSTQQCEAYVAVAVLNRMNRLGMPERG
jgi:hypothetical protein